MFTHSPTAEFLCSCAKLYSVCFILMASTEIFNDQYGGGDENNWALRIFQALYTIIQNKILAGEELYG